MNSKNLIINYFIDINNSSSTEIPNAFEYVMIPKARSGTNPNSFYFELLLIDIVKYISMNQCIKIQNSIQMLLQYKYYILIPQNNKSYYKVPITSLCTPIYHSDIQISNKNELFLLISKPQFSGSYMGGGLLHPLNESSFHCDDKLLMDCIDIQRNHNCRLGFDIYNPIQLPVQLPYFSSIPKFSSFHRGNDAHSQSEAQHPQVQSQSWTKPPNTWDKYSDRDGDSHGHMDSHGGTGIGYGSGSNHHNPGNEQPTKEDGLFSYASSIFNTASTLVETVATTGNSLIHDLVSSSTSSMSNAMNTPITLQNNNSVSIVKELAEGGFSMVYLVAGDEITKPNGNVTAHKKLNRMVKHQQQQYYYALKRMRCSDEETNREAIKEINILKRFNNTNNENIIQLLDYRIHKVPNMNIKEYDLLFPLYSDGSAWDHIEKYMNFTQDRRDGSDTLYINKKYPFDECMSLQIVYGVSNALMTLHTLGYTHRDLKPHNILLKFFNNNSGNDSNKRLVCPVLMDLGSVGPAKTNSPPISTKSQALDLEDLANSHTSPAFKPPELQSVPYNAYTCSQFVTDKQQLKEMEENIISDKGVVLDERMDIWSLGCVTFCLAFGLSPFESLKEGILKLGILNGSYTIPQGRQSPLPCGYNDNSIDRHTFSQEYVLLIQSMLQIYFKNRPYAIGIRTKSDVLLQSKYNICLDSINR